MYKCYIADMRTGIEHMCETS